VNNIYLKEIWWHVCLSLTTFSYSYLEKANTKHYVTNIAALIYKARHSLGPKGLNESYLRCPTWQPIREYRVPPIEFKGAFKLNLDNADY
jgi:hypothetical protein